MPAVISVGETGLTSALQMWMAELLGIDWQGIALTQQNRVPMMKGVFIYMTPLRVTGLSVPRVVYAPEIDRRIDARTNRWDVQIDFYGDDAMEQANITATIMRTSKATEMLTGTPITPLYASEPFQAAIVNSESQWEQRWSLDLSFQAEMAITTEQQFADQLLIKIAEIDTTFPSGA